MLKRAGIRLAGFAWALTALAGTQSAHSQEVITNGTIEDGGFALASQNASANVTGTMANGWVENTWQTGPTGYSVKYALDTSKKYAGKASLSVTSVKVTPQFWAPLTMKPGSKYSATVYLRGDASQEVVVQLRQLLPPYSTYGLASSTITSTGWTKVTLVGDAPVSAAAIPAGLFIHPKSPGTVWLDNASVIEAPATQAVIRKGQSFTKAYFGIHTHRDLNWPDLGGTVGAERMWDGSGQLVEIFPTSDLNKANWAGFDARIARAQRNGADLIMTLGGNGPKWASSDPTATDKSCALYTNANGEGAPPKDRTVWKNMVKAVVARAAGRIKYWEVWNEPYICDLFNQRRPTDNTKYLVDLAYDAYNIIKANGNPNKLVVLSPSFATSRLDFVDEYLALGGGKYADVISVHAYDNYLGARLGNDPTSGIPDAPEAMFVREHEILNLKNVLTKYNLSALPLWDTESGYVYAANADGSTNDTKGAPYVARHLLLTSLAGLDRTYYYSWDHRDDVVALSRELDAANSNHYTKSDAGKAYENMAKWLIGAQITDVVSPVAPGKAWVVTIKRASTGTTEYIAWEPTNTEIDYILPAGTVYASSLLGSKAPVAGTVKLNGWPQLLTSY